MILRTPVSTRSDTLFPYTTLSRSGHSGRMRNVSIGATASAKSGAMPKGRHRAVLRAVDVAERSEEHTSELQSLMRTSYADFYLQTFMMNFNIIITPDKLQHLICI